MVTVAGMGMVVWCGDGGGVGVVMATEVGTLVIDGMWLSDDGDYGND